MEPMFHDLESDVGRLRWGAPPVALLPTVLRDLWANEALPEWFTKEAGLPSGATMAALGSDYSGRASTLTRRGEHFLLFLLQERVDAIRPLACFKTAWPESLPISDVPFTGRIQNLLARAGYLSKPDSLDGVTFGQLLEIRTLGLKSLYEITTVAEVAIDAHSQRQEKQSSVPDAPVTTSVAPPKSGPKPSAPTELSNDLEDSDPGIGQTTQRTALQRPVDGPVADVNAFKWGWPPVPLLPESLRRLWKNEPLPRWLVEGEALPQESTIEVLGSQYWRTRDRLPSRVELFVQSLVLERQQAISGLICFDPDWPQDIDLGAIPLSARTRSTLGRARLLDDSRPLMRATFGDLLRVHQVGAKTLLEITTVVEAAIRHGLSERQSGRHRRSADQSPMAPARSFETEEWPPRDIADVLKEPWVSKVSAIDPRFAQVFPFGASTLEETLVRVVSHPAATLAELDAVRERLPEIRLAVDRIYSLSLEETLSELLAGLMGNRQAKLDALLARFGWAGDAPQTLDICGKLMGVTRERIRQMEEKARTRLKRFPYFIPNLDRALALLESSSPISLPMAAKLINDRGLSRQPFSPVSLLSTATLLGRKSDLTIVETHDEHFLVAEAKAPMVKIVASTARSMAGQAGIASVFNVVDRVGEKLASGGISHNNGDTLDTDEARQVLKGLSRCEFLDDDWFWFTDLPPLRNRLENVAKRILSVASPQPLQSVREGLRRAFRQRSLTNARYESLEVPPQFALVRFFESHPDFTFDGKFVDCILPLDYKTVLGDTDRMLVDAFRSFPSEVVDRNTLARYCLSRGMNDSTFGASTTFSPVLEHVGVDLWKLRGVAVDPAAVEAVRQENKNSPRQISLIDHGWTSDGHLRIAWAVPFLNSSATFGVPSEVHRYIAENKFRAVGKRSGRESGQIVITDYGSSYGYGPYLRYAGAEEGDVLIAEFDLAQSVVHLSISAAESLGY